MEYLWNNNLIVLH